MGTSVLMSRIWGNRTPNAFTRLNKIAQFLTILSLVSYVSSGNGHSKEVHSTSECLKSPEIVLIECRVLNVNDAHCVDNKTNVISIPQTIENAQGEINCTSPTPLDISFTGFKLSDYINTSFVRNAENVFNEATFVFSISFPLSEITSSREVIVYKYKNPEYKISFFLFRPGKSIFSLNTLQTTQLPQIFTLDYVQKNLIIPCTCNEQDITPELEHPEFGRQQNVTFPFDNTKGFVLSTNAPNVGIPVGSYSCKAKRQAAAGNMEEAKVTFEVKPKPDAIFQPQQDDVFVFANSELRLSCEYGQRVILEGHFRNKFISPTPFVSDTSVLQFGSVYEEQLLKVGDSGIVRCKTTEDSRILKTWNIKTLDIRNNSVLQFKKLNESFVVCESATASIQEMSLEAVFCQGVTECQLNEFCFDKVRGNHCPHILKAYPCNLPLASNQESPLSKRVEVNSLCLSMPSNDTTSSQGMIRCSSGNHSYQTNYFRGFDDKIYLNWDEAPPAALIDIFVPNVTMYPHNSYPFGCRAAKFISDGRLQWVIRGKDGSEILLHKNRVKDIYGRYASPLDYKLYTVRESDIRLIYPNDYDVLCLVPMMNATAWVRHHKRINVAAKQAPIVEILSGASAVIFILVCVVVYVLWRLKKAKEAIRNLTEKEVQEFLEGNPEALKSAGDKDAHEVVDSLPYDKKFEIPRDKLLIDSENCLGKGAFGTVLKGRVEGISEFVAVKTVNSDCEVNRFKGFLSELKIMIYIGRHSNIVSLIGASTEKIKEKTLYIVVEFCANGSLEGHLRTNKGCFLDQIENNEVKPGGSQYTNFNGTTSNASDCMMTTIDLVRWSFHIARGMEYLADKKVVHADLAARNVLIDYKGNAKITDFGLSRQLFDYTQYVKKQQEPLPWRWMAIESLQQLRFSTHSDVWAYGILLWEIFSVGDVPYPGLAWDIQFVQQLCNGLRLIKPPHCTDQIYNFMLDCWQEAPAKRPSFSFLTQYFKSLLETLNVELDASKELNPASGYTNVLGYMRVGDFNNMSGNGNTVDNANERHKSTNLYVNS